ncbi:hypothetical protein [Streptosporangium sp. NPDC000396]|uniref:hypothetical protein n=1 Tax=Streptosporangium sp. NPDC000396 TaxID=3366185 RepID=UPI0036BDF80B
MKLMRLGAPGEEVLAVRADDGRMHALSDLAADIDGVFLASGGIGRAREALAAGTRPVLDPLGPWPVNTATPAGVALGLPDTPYLRAGDVVELSIDGLGTQRQSFANA